MLITYETCRNCYHREKVLVTMLSVPFLLDLLLSSLSAVLNAFALVVMLNSWHLYKGGNNKCCTFDCRHKKERVGYFAFVFVLFCDLLFVVSITIKNFWYTL